MSSSKEALLQELRNRTPKSGTYWEHARDLVPGGLISGARKMEPYPVYVAHSKGAYTWDIDDNRYIDCAMSFGVHILGHGPEVVLKALHEQCELGMSYGMPHTREVEFTKRLIECVPCAEQVMVCNTGTESTMMAWRLAKIVHLTLLKYNKCKLN